MVPSRDCRIHAVRSSVLDAELIALRITEHHPTTGLELTPIIEDGRAERTESFDLLRLVPLHWHQIQVDTILHHLPFRDGHEDEVRPSIVRWTREPELIAWHINSLEWIAGDGTPEFSDAAGVAAVERDVEHG
jgi:hypothetical protein